MIRNLAIAALLTCAATDAMAASAWTTSGVNFRDGPGTYYDVIGYLPKCASLTTYEYDGGWVRVNWDGQYGWVTAKYLAESNAHCGYGKKKSYSQGSGGYDSSY